MATQSGWQTLPGLFSQSQVLYLCRLYNIIRRGVGGMLDGGGASVLRLGHRFQIRPNVGRKVVCWAQDGKAIQNVFEK